MRKLLVLTSVLAILGAGNAFAFDASNGFRPSEQSDLTAPSFEVANPVDRTVAANVQSESGSHAVIARRVGWSAADGFGPTQRNDLTAPSFEIPSPVDGAVTASIKSKRGEQGSHAMAVKPAAWSAADGFGPSRHNDLPAPRFEVAG
ncbi:hypothetical protein [Chelativorans salis]|uniref:Uncharacterized protein n=1 Tax=Chelativorans salis TaxID=2978478 RepID=A0ABT2LXF2_9HYPH|nr:hypothetical protein [Chelativorans sp. EGI FJ00035]MCT7377869.1 hypothetical protein [Chelativorans sp. EGI FJ00035]